MNILVVNGSPLGKKGNTYILQEAFVKGAKKANASVEEIFLNKKKIKPCLGCYTCWIRTPGKCIIKDDQSKILEKFEWADTFVLATPLYVDGMTAQTKTFIDRLLPMTRPDFVLIDGHCRHPPFGNRAGKFVLISNCGFHELDNFDALVMHCKRMCLNMGSEYLGHLLRPQGPLLKYREAAPDIIGKALEAVETAGADVAGTGKLSQSAMDAVCKELMPKDAYVEMVNAFWRSEIQKTGAKRKE